MQLSSIPTITFFFTTATIFSTVFYMSNDVLTDFFRKTFAVSCVVCKGLKSGLWKTVGDRWKHLIYSKFTVFKTFDALHTCTLCNLLPRVICGYIIKLSSPNLFTYNYNHFFPYTCIKSILDQNNYPVSNVLKPSIVIPLMSISFLPCPVDLC